MKILLVFGTRPEAIKMAPLVKALQQQPENFESIVCVTGQHREMLDQVLRIFDIKPDFDLNIMQQGQDLYDVTTRVLTGMREVLAETKPDLVLVHGDTTTSTATALAAFYQQIKVGHIEAGLRTHDIYSPWPEEMNRQLTGRIATLHFAPTPLSRQNLIDEGVNGDRIIVTGNTVIDALHMVLERIEQDEEIQNQLTAFLKAQGLSLEPARRRVLITGHRRENFGDGFIHICEAIRELALKYPDTDFIYPVHLNPNVRKPVSEILGLSPLEKGAGGLITPLGHGAGGLTPLPNIHLIAPLDYLPFVWLMSLSTLVLTDSGGIQEEAPGLGKPVLVMRDTTERPEALEAGTVILVGTDKTKIIREVSLLLDSPEHYNQMAQATNPYGDGHACERILSFLKKS